MTVTTTGKAAAAKVAKALLADRIALVETLGAALDTHRQAVEAVTTARTAAEDAATKARKAFDAATAGGWTRPSSTTPASPHPNAPASARRHHHRRRTPLLNPLHPMPRRRSPPSPWRS